MNDIRDIDFLPELKFTASRSGGKGGQNVNKVSTKVELHFDYLNSALLNDEQKQLIGTKLVSFINKENILKIVSQEERSQLLNKETTIRKFYLLLERAFRKKKRRLKSKPSRSSKEKRLKSKKLHSEKKKLRKNP
ncbi:MAG TPA: alternative ribosome rescue aminoacyl-tRNA hydrolase ArfB [Bacteroidia bacterium]|nr:alternative ribosome rescue aminoacyl-tRNA hydrolase ArfB [Bacteroidia bacterium]